MRILIRLIMASAPHKDKRSSSCAAVVPLTRRPLRSGNYVAPTPYRKLLLDIAFKLQPWDVEELSFFVKDAVPDETAAEALTALGLLECLERHKLLGQGEYTSLRKYLTEIGREDLAARLAPPEELGSSSATPAYFSGPLSRIVTSLEVNNMMVWPLNTYRKSALEVFRELTVEEVEQIRWLCQDFLRAKPRWSEVVTGVELLYMMEKNGLVGPGNYSFLVDCLEEIGRPDLVLLVLPPSLPYLPASMDIPSLLHHKRIETIQLKKTQYQFGMRSLMKVTDVASRTTARNAGGWYKRILDGLSPQSLERHSAYIIESLPTTLINTSLHLNALLDSIDEYECNGDTVKFAGHIAECEEHLDLLQSLMEQTDWDIMPRKRESLATSRQYHPVRQASYGAFSGVAELLLEFSGAKQQFQEESRHLGRVLTRLESILRLSGYMWSLTSWLIASLQVSVCSPVSLGKYDFLFRLLVRRNRHIIRSNGGMLEDVLSRTPAGGKLLKHFKNRKLISDSSSGKDMSSASTLLHIAATPIPVFVFMVLLLSEHTSLAPSDLDEIIASLKDHISEREEAFGQINQTVTMMVLQGISLNIETFRRSKLQQFCSDNVHGIEEIFSY